MIATRRQALCGSTLVLGGAMLAPQLANAETAAPKPAIAADLAQKLVTEQFMIDAADPGIKLYIRNKRTEDLKQFSSEKTLLFVHGATQPSEATFDLPLEGLSWMDYIAQHGWDVYLIDVRGYGRSTRPLFDVFPDNPSDVQANGVANLYASLRMAAQTGRPHEMPVQRYDIRDSSGRFVERHWRPINTPILDDESRVVVLLHQVEDVTQEGVGSSKGLN
jgi:pimeloyl-ACP methyl ester carboxylesterase